jgi:hypothetical protein
MSTGSLNDDGTCTCALCGGTFPKGWTDAEAEAEYQEKFGMAAPVGADRAILCDPCNELAEKAYEQWVAEGCPPLPEDGPLPQEGDVLHMPIGDPIEGQSIPIHVVSEEACEEVDFVLCADADAPTPFTDNVHTTCAGCGVAIIHRPYVPKKPMKVCLKCASGLVNKQ